jgi:Xaa-Pro aminopeptidase
MSVELRRIAWPDFGPAPEYPPPAPLAQFETRVEASRRAMRAAGFTHLAVYGDREHFGNLAWLTGFDPRFEEALLIVGMDGDPLLMVGNECVNYAPVSPLVRERRVRLERFPDFSLPGQPREGGRAIEDILRAEGVDAHSRAGFAGWKPHAGPHRIEAPSWLVDAFRFAAGWENVMDAAALFLDPRSGLRLRASAHDLVFFEYAGVAASEAMKRVLLSVREGARDHEMLAAAGYPGLPLGCAMTLKTGSNRLSLSSARGEIARRGDRFSCGICFWGANCCRAGWVAEGPEDLPAAAADYLEAFAFPYTEAMRAWFAALRPGAAAGELHAAVHSRLPAGLFHIFLNAGHLIHLEEWLAAPVWEGSDIPLQAGMVMQSDVIPSHPHYYSARMEDGYALVDDVLRSELPAGMLARCARRAGIMREELGFPVSEGVLPLSNLPGWQTPFVLRPEFTLAATPTP